MGDTKTQSLKMDVPDRGFVQRTKAPESRICDAIDRGFSCVTAGSFVSHLSPDLTGRLS